MQSDDFGFGVSRLIWSKEARIDVPVGDLSDDDEYTLELKNDRGIGFGFNEESPPELTVLASPSNTSSGTPNWMLMFPRTVL